MVRVNQKQLQLESRLCYAAFALVLDGNRNISAAGIQQVICDNFQNRLKYTDRGDLTWVLSSSKNSNLISKLDAPRRCYALTPEFYSALIHQIELETKSLLELCSMHYSTNAGILWLYERLCDSGMPPTPLSVFSQARDSLRNPEGKE